MINPTKPIHPYPPDSTTVINFCLALLKNRESGDILNVRTWGSMVGHQPTEEREAQAVQALKVREESLAHTRSVLDVFERLAALEVTIDDHCDGIAYVEVKQHNRWRHMRTIIRDESGKWNDEVPQLVSDSAIVAALAVNLECHRRNVVTPSGVDND